jgi:hypothetical protein
MTAICESFRNNPRVVQTVRRGLDDINNYHPDNIKRQLSV